MIYAVIIATALESLADPPLRSIAAAHVPSSAQGELQGALTSIGSITTIIGPLIFTQAFGYFTSPAAPVAFAGAPYALASCFLVGALIVFFLKIPRSRAVGPQGAENVGPADAVAPDEPEAMERPRLHGN
jgi:DHA1 family tetracycline resistance protein-like MFS transporter